MKIENTTNWENVVAMAAPAVPIAGTKSLTHTREVKVGLFYSGTQELHRKRIKLVYGLRLTSQGIRNSFQSV